MKSEKKLGLICLGWGILYAFVQTKYFGNNLFPQTKVYGSWSNID